MSALVDLAPKKPLGHHSGVTLALAIAACVGVAGVGLAAGGIGNQVSAQEKRMDRTDAIVREQDQRLAAQGATIAGMVEALSGMKEAIKRIDDRTEKMDERMQKGGR